ncbi:MAG: hypothetical protein KAU31_05155, partial [Spirochaetaceae bacterium]|nr:hypothetical protein [Spirochaetaceae bacterium]
MNRHTIRVLEFEKIRTQLREYCLTTEADETLRKERVRLDPGEVQQLLSISRALRRCLESIVEFPALSFPPMDTVLTELEKEGAVLEAEDLAGIASYARSATLLRTYLVRAVSETGDATVVPLVDAIPDVKPVA